MSNRLSLDKLRETILANQGKGVANPSKPSEAIVVDNQGRINLASNLSSEEKQGGSVVQQDVFHGRYENELASAKRCMPQNTKHLNIDGFEGWSYQFSCELGQPYEMFAYFDGSYYQVTVLIPEVEEKYQSAHTGHIFKDGNICFGANYNSGRPTLVEAYAKSVLWATGFSYMILSGDATFPFSINNL